MHRTVWNACHLGCHFSLDCRKQALAPTTPGPVDAGVRWCYGDLTPTDKRIAHSDLFGMRFLRVHSSPTLSRSAYQPNGRSANSARLGSRCLVGPPSAVHFTFADLFRWKNESGMYSKATLDRSNHQVFRPRVGLEYRVVRMFFGLRRIVLRPSLIGRMPSPPREAVRGSEREPFRRDGASRKLLFGTAPEPIDVFRCDALTRHGLRTLSRDVLF